MHDYVVYGAAIGVLAAVTAALALTQGSGGELTPPDAPKTAYNVTEDGTRYTVHPDELLMGCPGKDCIPSIDDPAFASVEQADGWLDGSDLVIGIAQDGAAKAYPLRILNVHEIVNDRIAGRPVAVTYCPLCRSGLAFDRRVQGTPVEFGVSGRLYNANLVMYDRATGTFWSQVQGTAIVGPLVPTELDIVTSEITEWSKWQDAHPDTQVLSRDTGIYPASSYGSNPYAGYDERQGVGFGVTDPDPRLHSKTIVYGAAAGGDAVAYPESSIEQEDIIQDTVGGVPVLVVENPESGGIHVYERRIDGETLSFNLQDNTLVDGDGDRWGFDGVAQAGPLQGAQLPQLNSHGFFWFAWSAFHPETSIYNASEAR